MGPGPQVFLAAAAAALQSETQLPALQWSPGPQSASQSRMPPHPSGAPHWLPAIAQVVGVQHCPAWQIVSPGHAPQSMTPPQPSAIAPQLAPPAEQLAGTQAASHWWVSSLQAEPAPQLPQSR